jgi:starvation-inducible DNA-binding protein
MTTEQTGVPHLGALHAVFEVPHTDLALAVDATAERIRALGHPAPGTCAEFGARTTIAEATRLHHNR